MPFLGLHPAGANRAEFQLGPVVRLATKNPIARLHDDADVFLAQLFGGLGQDVALHDRVHRKIQQLVAQVAPRIHIPVVAVMDQLLRRNIALGGFTTLAVEVVHMHFFALQRGLRQCLETLQAQTPFACMHGPHPLGEGRNVQAFRGQQIGHALLQRLQLGAQQTGLEFGDHVLNRQQGQQFFLTEHQAGQLVGSPFVVQLVNIFETVVDDVVVVEVAHLFEVALEGGF